MPIEYSADVPDASETHASYSETLAVEGGTSQQVTLRCPWSQRYVLAVDIVAKGRLWPQYAIGTMANKCVIRPEPGKYTQDGQGLAYEFALVTVTYDFWQQGKKDKTTDPNTGNEILYTETIEPVWHAAQVKNQDLRWVNADGAPVDVAVDKRWQRMKFIRTLYGMSIIPQFFDLIGCVNDAPYYSDILDMNFNIGTLLFIPPHLERTITGQGTKGWNIRVGFDFNEKGWNLFYNSSYQTFNQIWNNTTNTRYIPYPYADMGNNTARASFLWNKASNEKLVADGKMPKGQPNELLAWAKAAGVEIIDKTKNMDRPKP